MRAIGQYILIEKINEEVKMHGMLLSGMDKNNQRFRKGKIISCGSEITDTLQPGEVIYYDIGGSFEMIINEKVVTIIRQRDVLAVD
jgi:co-chaperonin GroES (HSP10)